MSWIIDIPPVSPVTPGGSSGDIQFNNGGAFGGEALVPLAHGGTAADLSGTGGAHFVLRQSTVGGAITVSQLAYSDLSGSAPAPAWSALTGTLSNGQVIPYGDVGISRIAVAGLAIGNGTDQDYSGSLKLGSIVLLKNAAGSPAMFSVQNTNSTSEVYSQLLNDLGVGMYLASFGSTYASVGYRNTTSIAAGNGTSPNAGMSFLTNSNVTSGGTAPMWFITGGYQVTPQLTIRPTGVIQIGGTGNLDANNFVGDTGISRLGAASLAVGNGTAGDYSGSLKLGSLVATAAAPTVATAQIGYGSTVSATANTTGGGLTLPLLAAGYIIVNIAGTAYKVPYYAN
jgi:hypothetical protein